MAAYHTLSRFLPDDIVEKILIFNFPREQWVRYWKNQTVGLIESSRLMFSTHNRIHNMNSIYLNNLAYHVLNNHIDVLGEISHMFQNVSNPNFDILMGAIFISIKNRIRITLPR